MAWAVIKGKLSATVLACLNGGVNCFGRHRQRGLSDVLCARRSATQGRQAEASQTSVPCGACLDRVSSQGETMGRTRCPRRLRVFASIADAERSIQAGASSYKNIAPCAAG